MGETELSDRCKSQLYATPVSSLGVQMQYTDELSQRNIDALPIFLLSKNKQTNKQKTKKKKKKKQQQKTKTKTKKQKNKTKKQTKQKKKKKKKKQQTKHLAYLG